MKTNGLSSLMDELLDKSMINDLPITKHAVSVYYLNTELIQFVSSIIGKYRSIEDRILILLKFKKVIIQTPRISKTGHDDNGRVFFDPNRQEQLLNDPIRFIDAELEYLKERQAIISTSNDSIQKEWLTAKEVCVKFLFSKSSLNRRVAEGLPHAQLGGKKMFSVSQISEWLKNQTE